MLQLIMKLWKEIQVQVLVGFMNKINDAMDIIDENYPNFEQITKVMRGNCDISCYKEMLQARQAALSAAF